MATSQGLDLQGAMTKDRLKWRIASLKVHEKGKKRRANKDGQKVTEYWLDPDNIKKKLALQRHLFLHVAYGPSRTSSMHLFLCDR
ncbi:MAG: hypothetical protein HY912_20630 [Desulfomonile tiedjei]|uniref:Uncharacterized protein n=1 Tax=Desulfomonile tiedjei TaxID=2358 RepID=A0A9D6V7A4_9BACT|nr:hypothetical protein [Desulfomonile tiedjei]